PNLVRPSGAIALGAPPQALTVAVEDPARYAATVFGEVLAARGIVVAGAVETTTQPLPPGVRVLAGHDSPPLAEIVKVVNKVSQNLHTEMLLRVLGARVKGEGTVEAGHAAVDDFLHRLGVPAESWALQAGSGLSRSGDRLVFYAAVNHHTASASDSVAALDAIASLLASQ